MNCGEEDGWCVRIASSYWSKRGDSTHAISRATTWTLVQSILPTLSAHSSVYIFKTPAQQPMSVFDATYERALAKVAPVSWSPRRRLASTARTKLLSQHPAPPFCSFLFHAKGSVRGVSVDTPLRRAMDELCVSHPRPRVAGTMRKSGAPSPMRRRPHTGKLLDIAGGVERIAASDECIRRSNEALSCLGERHRPTDISASVKGSLCLLLRTTGQCGVRPTRH